MTARFVEVADRVHVLRDPLLHVNVTLVVGDGAALLVDTLSTAGQARELAEAARAVTPHPWTIVNTHHHFDHCFGNATQTTYYATATPLAVGSTGTRGFASNIGSAIWQDISGAVPAEPFTLGGTVSPLGK